MRNPLKTLSPDGVPWSAVLWDFTKAFAVTFVLFLAFAAISACSTPAVRDRVVEVRVPIATQPIKPEQVPALPSPLPPRPDSLSAAADVLLSKVCEFVAYALKADPLLRVSAGQSPSEPQKFPECEGENR